MQEKSRVLITGGTGFVGRHVIQSVRSAGWPVVATTRNQSKIVNDCADKDVVWVDTETHGLDTLFDKYGPEISAIVHVATTYDQDSGGEFELFRTNVAWPMGILKQAISHKIGIFINTDSFFNSPHVWYEHQSLYTLSKRHFLEWGKEIAGTANINFVNLVLHHVYGHGDDERKFISVLARACLNGDKLKMTEGFQKRDFVYIKDVADAYVKVLENAMISEATGFRSFDIGTGNPISVRDFAEYLNTIFGGRADLVFGALPYRKGEMAECKADISSAVEVGWRAKYSLAEGLQEMFNNFKEERDL